MPKKSITTNPSAERNTLPEMRVDPRLASLSLPDLRMVPIKELAAICDAAELVSQVLLGVDNQPRVEKQSGDIIECHSYHVHTLQDAIYEEMRQRTPADRSEAEARGGIMVNRLLTGEDPWPGIAEIATELSGNGKTATKPAKPSPAASRDETETSPWQKLYGEFLRVKAADIERDITDDEGTRLGDREAELVLEMVATPAPYRHAIIEKLDILQDCMDQGHGWSDNRDRLLLASIRRDVQNAA